MYSLSMSKHEILADRGVHCAVCSVRLVAITTARVKSDVVDGRQSPGFTVDGSQLLAAGLASVRRVSVKMCAPEDSTRRVQTVLE